ncbi:MAG: ATP phosphoribosyltransferase regulatory subunit [Anaerovibrio sp.]|uniref:ATP phosphoribosyltransferase regulatory subunit n=1 Tax=Anaerovibrio slackiae TaxID=2652309 RepID=A0A6I2ULZ4_9FIRM|nr:MULTISPECIES: ATP phosphoribosyltransferase regulatory subunit [Anaerovibrio]MBQ2009252.1 ATP phosphoribosyltransferase regulatory subunit [Selenomonadaceae bacterium]MBQ5651327.1 ATP phosphoribosyltransferase regulatory subunit [Selenomonadaceae bacterium]MCI6098767.1 ATP phosphoribosyltransferase regulatory subunit [Selenomonadaceae bacterium]MCI6483540.1 ATP phosphoribosyltransferase regulatory subunit [Selenomonadaceae bacterium]MEE1308409.1 ATP phosphoribosyltransferase regulatory subu
MSNKDLVLEIPYGTRDFLPQEAAEKRAIEARIARQFKLWGYDEVVTPTIEFLDTLTMGNGSNLEPQMFKLFDKQNRTMALRHEMTTPIARVVASRLGEEWLPHKLSYISSVFRYEKTQTGRQCEFHQAGVELIGSSKATADAEMIALAVSIMKEAGLKDFQICLGQVEFINGLMQQCCIFPKQQEQIKDAIERRDLVALGEIVDATELSETAKDMVKQLPLLHGDKNVLKKAYNMAMNEQSRRALDNLTEIYELLEAYGVAEYVTFDLGVIRDFSYYTGMVFEAYTPGLGFPLCGGGRYDHMLTDFGRALPATGFAVGIERILLALEREGLAKPKVEKDVYVAYAPGLQREAIRQVQALRAEGRTCELAMAASLEQEADAYRQEKGYKELVFIRQG